MIMLVCGGRAYTNKEFLFSELDKIHVRTPLTKLINGGAAGADELATLWAKERKIPFTTYPAWWNLEGKAAGISRNIRMLKQSKPNYVIAFPGGRGTKHMVRLAQSSGVPIINFMSS